MQGAYGPLTSLRTLLASTARAWRAPPRNCKGCDWSVHYNPTQNHKGSRLRGRCVAWTQDHKQPLSQLSVDILRLCQKYSLSWDYTIHFSHTTPPTSPVTPPQQSPQTPPPPQPLIISACSIHPLLMYLILDPLSFSLYHSLSISFSPPPSLLLFSPWSLHATVCCDSTQGLKGHGGEKVSVGAPSFSISTHLLLNVCSMSAKCLHRGFLSYGRGPRMSRDPELRRGLKNTQQRRTSTSLVPTDILKLFWVPRWISWLLCSNIHTSLSTLNRFPLSALTECAEFQISVLFQI